MEAERRVAGHLEADLELARVFAVVPLARDRHLGGKAEEEARRLGEVGAGEGQVDRRAALHAERRDRVEGGRLGVGRLRRCVAWGQEGERQREAAGEEVAGHGCPRVAAAGRAGVRAEAGSVGWIEGILARYEAGG